MTEPVRDTLTKLLQKMGIRAAQIGSDKPLLADGEFHFVSSWHFEVNVKDSIIRNVLNSETVVDEQALTEFERFNRAQLVKDVDIKLYPGP